MFADATHHFNAPTTAPAHHCDVQFQPVLALTTQERISLLKFCCLQQILMELFQLQLATDILFDLSKCPQ